MRNTIRLAALICMVVMAACASPGGGGDDSTTTSAGNGGETTIPASTTSSTLEPSTLSVGVYPGTLLSLPDYVGVEKGIFAEHGIELDMVTMSSGPENIAGLASGTLDVTGVSADLVMQANAEGQDLAVLVEKWPASIYTWLARTDWATPNAGAGYPDVVKDFAGARVGVTARGAQTELITRAFLSDAGLDPETSVDYVAVGAGAAAIAAFQADQVDIMVAFEPSQSILIHSQGIAKPVLDLRAGEGPDYFAVWSNLSQVGDRAKMDADPDVYRRYRAAFIETIEWMQDPANEDEVIAIAQGLIDLEPEVVEIMVRENLGIYGTVYRCAAHENLGRYLVTTEQLEEAQIPACEDLVWDSDEYRPEQ
ncbi:MAG TPA: ABC transporter substrate-binding protein [Acidimicrobiia bacterium]